MLFASRANHCLVIRTRPYAPLRRASSRRARPFLILELASWGFDSRLHFISMLLRKASHTVERHYEYHIATCCPALHYNIKWIIPALFCGHSGCLVVPSLRLHAAEQPGSISCFRKLSLLFFSPTSILIPMLRCLRCFSTRAGTALPVFSPLR